MRRPRHELDPPPGLVGPRDWRRYVRFGGATALLRKLCCCPSGCFPDCQIQPTNTPTYFDPCRVETITLNTNSSFADYGTYVEWFWSKNYFVSFYFELRIRCDKATGEVAANINDTGSDPYWGGADSIWAGYKVVGVTCAAGNLSGTFVLTFLGAGGPCVGMTVTVNLN